MPRINKPFFTMGFLSFENTAANHPPAAPAATAAPAAATNPCYAAQRPAAAKDAPYSHPHDT